ncbi:MAG: hypothetical protein ABFS45_18655 [Pseudomonadota bacterium]
MFYKRITTPNPQWKKKRRMKSRFNYGKQLTLGLGLIACMVLPVQAEEQVQVLLVFGHKARALH